GGRRPHQAAADDQYLHKNCSQDESVRFPAHRTGAGWSGKSKTFPQYALSPANTHNRLSKNAIRCVRGRLKRPPTFISRSDSAAVRLIVLEQSEHP
ncbi:MAG: hypothetical protein ABI876_00185, partial [Bacteroidota bacterium]